MYLKSREEAKAFLLFMAQERARHRKDINNIDNDMLAVARKWGLTIPRIAIAELDSLHIETGKPPLSRVCPECGGRIFLWQAGYYAHIFSRKTGSSGRDGCDYSERAEE